MCFTDGKIGAILDRNGLRPSRYLVTEDGTVLLSSEMGVLPIDQSSVKKMETTTRQDFSDRFN